MRHAAEPVVLETATVPSPIGSLALFARDGALVGLCFEGGEAGLRHHLERRFGAIEARPGAGPLAAALARYLAGEIGAIDALPVDTGGTEFQQKVWRALRAIPAGRTLSYHEIAEQIGAPYAVRAVGAANGQNPVAIVVPCHRVIAADGTLCGYGGGLHRKQWLLEHEGVRLKEADQGRLPI